MALTRNKRRAAADAPGSKDESGPSGSGSDRQHRSKSKHRSIGNTPGSKRRRRDSVASAADEVVGATAADEETSKLEGSVTSQGTARTGRGDGKQRGTPAGDKPPRAPRQAGSPSQQYTEEQPQAFQDLLGTLISRYPQYYPHLCLTGPMLTFGRGPGCHVNFHDPGLPPELCQLELETSAEGDKAVSLKCLAPELVLAVNSAPLRKNQQVLLKSGDEIAITGSSSEPYSFVFTSHAEANSAARTEEQPEGVAGAVPQSAAKVKKARTPRVVQEGVDGQADEDGERRGKGSLDVQMQGDGEEDAAPCQRGADLESPQPDSSLAEETSCGNNPQTGHGGAEAATGRGTVSSDLGKALKGTVRLAGPGTQTIQILLPADAPATSALAALPLEHDQIRATMLQLFGSLGLGRSKVASAAGLQSLAAQEGAGLAAEIAGQKCGSSEGDIAAAAVAAAAAGEGRAARANAKRGGDEAGGPSDKGAAAGKQGDDATNVAAEGGAAAAAAALGPAARDETAERHAKLVDSFRDELACMIISPGDIEHGLDAFPHHLGKGTRQRLLSAAFVHLKRAAFARHTAGLSSMSNKVLLSGPYGSDIYQEKLVRALAKDMGAHLLVYDHAQVIADVASEEEEAAATSPNKTSCDGAPGAAGGGGLPGLVVDDEDDDLLDLLGGGGGGADEDRPDKAELTQVWRAPPSDRSSRATWTSGPLSVIRKRVRYSQQQQQQQDNAAGGGSGTGLVAGPGMPLPPRGSGGATGRASKSSGATAGLVFKVGDRVRYLGSSSSGREACVSAAGPILGLPPSSIAGIFCGLPSAGGSRGGRGDHGHAGAGSGPGSGKDGKGPWVGLRGRVVVTSEDNPKKVGVRFDHPVPGGSNLSKKCEEGQGYYCSASDLRLESAVDRLEEANAAATDALFDAAAQAAANGPLVVLVKDLEKYLMEDTTRYMQFAKRLEALGQPRSSSGGGAGSGGGGGSGVSGNGGTGTAASAPARLLLVGSHTADARRERGGPGGLFSRLGSSHPLLDLGFIDGIPRLEERNSRSESSKSAKYLGRLLPNRVTLHAPPEEPAAAEWKRMLEADVATMRENANRGLVRSMLARCGLECADLASLVVRDQALSSDTVEKVVGWAVAHHLMEEEQQQDQDKDKGVDEGKAEATQQQQQAKDKGVGEGKADATQQQQQQQAKDNDMGVDKDKDDATQQQQQQRQRPGKQLIKGDGQQQEEEGGEHGMSGATAAVAAVEVLGSPVAKLQIKASSLMAGVEMLRISQAEAAPAKSGLKDVATDNDFEKRLLAEVIPADEVGVGFDDIGALEGIKQTLREVVMLPLQRPELFSRGSLTKPTKGVLLFGPPGTGKTMLAKAVACESGANFINASMSSLASKWFGEGEKYVRALFSLAHKIAPSVIFIDEVDSMLGRRDKSGEHEAMRKIKNEFMANWDGLRTCEADRVLVLAATNRPMDLDEAVIRRMPRRLFVDLPDVPNRIKVLNVILQHEVLAPGFDYDELARMAEGYSGSDLHNLCVAAAYRPIRDFLEAEKKEKKAAAEIKAAAEKEGGSGDGQQATSAKEWHKDEQAGAGEAAAVQGGGGSGTAGLADNPMEGLEQQQTAPPIAVATPTAAAAPAAGEQPGGSGDGKQQTPVLRPLTLADFKAAMEQVGASVSQDAHHMNELKQWNEMYGEGGNRRKSPLPYFM